MKSVTKTGLAARSAPPMLCHENATIHEIPGEWWLLHTKPRNEKALAWNLLDSGIDYFLPLARWSRRYGRHRQEVVLPLFAGYMFCACCSEEDRFVVINTARTVGIIEVVDQDKLRGELEQIRRALGTPRQVDLFPGIKTGRRCRVIAGSLKGIEGVVVTRRDISRLFLDVSILGQSAVLEIDALLVEPIG
jgi:transcription termination/antitermination protein NusG